MDLFFLLLDILVEIIAYGSTEAFDYNRATRRGSDYDSFSKPVYMVLGIMFGALSLAIYPKRILADDNVSLFALFFVPVLVGILAEAVGRYRESKQQRRIEGDRFISGFLFAFLYSLARYCGAS